MEANRLLCSRPWKSKFLDSRGELKPCPFFAGSLKDDDFNSLRNSILKGERLWQCESCHGMESLGLKSERLKSLENSNYATLMRMTQRDGSIPTEADHISLSFPFRPDYISRIESATDNELMSSVFKSIIPEHPEFLSFETVATDNTKLISLEIESEISPAIKSMTLNIRSQKDLAEAEKLVKKYPEIKMILLFHHQKLVPRGYRNQNTQIHIIRHGLPDIEEYIHFGATTPALKNTQIDKILFVHTAYNNHVFDECLNHLKGEFENKAELEITQSPHKLFQPFPRGDLERLSLFSFYNLVLDEKLNYLGPKNLESFYHQDADKMIAPPHADLLRSIFVKLSHKNLLDAQALLANLNHDLLSTEEAYALGKLLFENNASEAKIFFQFFLRHSLDKTAEHIEIAQMLHRLKEVDDAFAIYQGLKNRDLEVDAVKNAYLSPGWELLNDQNREIIAQFYEHEIEKGQNLKAKKYLAIIKKVNGELIPSLDLHREVIDILEFDSELFESLTTHHWTRLEETQKKRRQSYIDQIIQKLERNERNYPQETILIHTIGFIDPKKDLKRYAELMEEFIHESPHHPKFLEHLTSWHQNNTTDEELELILPLLIKGREYFPKNLILNKSLVWFQRRIGNLVESFNQHLYFLKIDPTDHEVQNSLLIGGWDQLPSSQLAILQQHIDSALKINPQDYELLASKSKWHYIQGEDEESLRTDLEINKIFETKEPDKVKTISLKIDQRSKTKIKILSDYLLEVSPFLIERVTHKHALVARLLDEGQIQLAKKLIDKIGISNLDHQRFLITQFLELEDFEYAFDLIKRVGILNLDKREFLINFFIESNNIQMAYETIINATIERLEGRDFLIFGLIQKSHLSEAFHLILQCVQADCFNDKQDEFLMSIKAESLAPDIQAKYLNLLSNIRENGFGSTELNLRQAWVYKMMGNHDRAVELLIEIYSTTVDKHLVLADMKDSDWQFENDHTFEKLDSFYSVLLKNQRLPLDMLRAFCDLLLITKKVELAKKTIAIIPENINDLEILISLGDYFHKNEIFSSAITYYSKAVELAPSHIENLKLLGWIFKKAKKFREARRVFMQVIEIAPSDNDAQDELRRLNSGLKNKILNKLGL